MTNLQNISPIMQEALRPHIERTNQKVILSTNDIGLAEHKAHKGDFVEARKILANMRSAAKIISNRIKEAELYVESLNGIGRA